MRYSNNKGSTGYILLLIIAGLCLPIAGSAESLEPSQQNGKLVYIITIDGAISAGTESSVVRGIEEANKLGAELIVIQINTEGGAVDATVGINRAIDASAVPVVCYVAPAGSWAASAGTYILINGHIAAVAPGTLIGACEAYSLFPTSGTAEEKTKQFTLQYLKETARKRGRNVTTVERFFTENLAVGPEDAWKLGVIDIPPDRSQTLQDLFQAVNGETLMIGEERVKIDLEGARLFYHKYTPNEIFKDAVGDPFLASTIFLPLGILLIIFGISSPEYIAPELIGAFLLILGIYGMGLFEANIAGIVLISLGAILLILELATPSFGIFGIVGLASMIFGILFLPSEPWFSPHAYRNLLIGSFAVVAPIGAFLLFAMGKIMQVRKKKPTIGEKDMIGQKGFAMSDIKEKGQVKVRGEIWSAYSDQPIKKGDIIEVLDEKGLTLKVRKVSE
jgi:membrane-bound serine protease (ClpP class)